MISMDMLCLPIHNFDIDQIHAQAFSGSKQDKGILCLENKNQSKLVNLLLFIEYNPKHNSTFLEF